jgi:predicted transposase YbfD/YdcC
MRSVVVVEATREIGETVERRYYVSSLPPNAARIANAVRSRWRIENSMHWVLDMAPCSMQGQSHETAFKISGLRAGGCAHSESE